MINRSKFLLLLLLTLSVSFSQAEKNFIRFDKISIEKGLSVSVTFDIVQDQLGFIWVATQDGLNRFDGNEFKIYRNLGGNDNEVSTNDILVLGVDRHGNIWIGTRNLGVDRFNPYTEVFTNFRHDPNDDTSLSHDYVSSIILDDNNDLWIGTSNGLNKFNEETNNFTAYQTSSNLTTISSNKINSMYIDFEKNLWIGTENGLNRFDERNNNFTRFGVGSGDQKFTNANIRSLTEDNDGNIWVATDRDINILNKRTGQIRHRGNDPRFFRNVPNITPEVLLYDKEGNIWVGDDVTGLYRIDLTKREYENYRENPSDQNSLANNNITNISMDRSGILWVNTYGGGVSKIRFARSSHFFHVKRNPRSNNTLTSNNITAIYADPYYVYYGTRDNGMVRFDLKTEQFRSFKVDPSRNSLIDNRITAIVESPDGKVWIGTKNGLDEMDRLRGRFTNQRVRPNSSTSIPSGNIKALYSKWIENITQDNKYVWIGTEVGLTRFDVLARKYRTFSTTDGINATFLVDNDVTSIKEDRAGNVWVGTTKGLSKFSKVDETFDNYTHIREDFNSLSNDRVLSIHVDNNANVWIGTQNGLNKYNRNTNNFQRYGIKEGLPNSVIYGILEDYEHNLWISTNSGITKFAYVHNEFTNYDVQDGLQSNEFNPSAYFKMEEDSDNKKANQRGKLYFGGYNGITEFFPTGLMKNTKKPLMAISNFYVNNVPFKLDSGINKTEEVILDYEFNNVAFDIASLEFTAPSKNKFEYKLEPIEQSYIQTSRRYIRYVDLAPNDYTFSYRGSNNDGEWSDKFTTVEISIRPPFYKETWFMILWITAALALIVMYPVVKIRSQRKREEELEGLVNERTKELSVKTDELEATNTSLNDEVDFRRKVEVDLREARDETDSILSNVSEGLFLLDVNFKISDQHSKELENIFERDNLSRTNFVELMKPLVTSKNLEALHDFLELLFNNDIDEDVVNDLNPLDNIEVFFESEIGKYQTKYLDFAFKRVNSEDKIISLLVTIRDMSAIVLLQKQLENAEAKNKSEMEQLLNILKVEPLSLKEFLESVDQEIHTISRTFEEEKDSYSEILNQVYRNIHNLKGNAGLLDLSFFVEKFHDIEDVISNIKTKPRLTGDDFLPIILDLNEIQKYVRSMNSLLERVLTMSKTISRKNKISFLQETFEENVRSIVDKMGTQMSKEARFNFKKEDNIPEKYEQDFKNIIIQLVKNSMVHGVETVDERRNINKAPSANLDLTIKKANGYFQFKYRDDGSGINIDKLKSFLKKQGTVDSQKIEKMSTSDLAKLIFKDGITTTEKADENSGRGEGMSIIRDIVHRNNGKIKFAFAAGKYFELSVKLPI